MGHGMRARAHDRHLAAQHVEELRQLLEAGAADEAAQRRHARIALAHLPERAGAVLAGFGPHGPELENLDHLAVAAIALLAEQDRSRRAQPDRHRDAEEERCREEEHERGQGTVQGRLGQPGATCQRAVVDMEQRHARKLGDAAPAERGSDLVGAETDVDRQLTQPAQGFLEPGLGTLRQGHDDEVDRLPGGKGEQPVDPAQHRVAADIAGGAGTPVVEEADEADTLSGGAKLVDEALALLAGADHHYPQCQQPAPLEVADEGGQGCP
jgi:hypothetical protein